MQALFRWLPSMGQTCLEKYLVSPSSNLPTALRGKNSAKPQPLAFRSAQSKAHAKSRLYRRGWSSPASLAFFLAALSSSAMATSAESSLLVPWALDSCASTSLSLSCSVWSGGAQVDWSSLEVGNMCGCNDRVGNHRSLLSQHHSHPLFASLSHHSSTSKPHKYLCDNSVR